MIDVAGREPGRPGDAGGAIDFEPMAGVAHPSPTVRETHSGVVLLLGDRAYKFKKPVDLGFLDFRDVRARVRCCRREVELNRRLAPDVYLGVGALTDPGGRPDEPAVVMRRMPEGTRLSSLVCAGVPVAEVVDRLARILATFHATADRGPDIDLAARPEAIRRRWDATLADVRRAGATVVAAGDVDATERLVHEFLAGRDRLFDDRIRHGRIVDGHGDLLCDDIFCLPDGPRVLDCLEFDDQLRHVDGLDDVAFLAMDLERLGAPSSARLLIDRYTDYANDPAPASLLHHYVAYRAYVRAKVAGLRHRQGDRDAAPEARSLAALALDHLRTGQVRLILVGGLPGSGKSTVAAGAADALGAVLLSSDVTRKAAVATETSSGTPFSDRFEQGIYDHGHTERTYGDLLRRAERSLGAGETVVVDASFIDGRHRTAAAQVAQRAHATLTAFRCDAPASVRDERLRRRPPGPSDATPQVSDRMSLRADPWPTGIVLPTTGPVAATVHRLLRSIPDGGPVPAVVGTDASAGRGPAE